MASTDERINFLANFELRGDRQVERSLDGITRQIITAKSATEGFGIGIEKTFRIFELGIGGAVAGGALGLIVEHIGKIGEEADAAREKYSKLLEELGKQPKTSAQVEAQREKITQYNRDQNKPEGQGFATSLQDFGQSIGVALSKYFNQKLQFDPETLTRSGQERELDNKILDVKRRQLEQEEQKLKAKERQTVFDKQLGEVTKMQTEHQDKLNPETVSQAQARLAGYQNTVDTSSIVDRARTTQKLQDDIAEAQKRELGERAKLIEAVSKTIDAIHRSEQEKLSAVYRAQDESDKITKTNQGLLGDTRYSPVIASHMREIGGGGRAVGGNVYNPHSKEIEKNTAALAVLTQTINANKIGGSAKTVDTSGSTYVY